MPINQLYEVDTILESVFEFLIGFYQSDNQNDRSMKKALVLEAANGSLIKSTSAMMSAFESSIECLMFVALKSTMPQEIFEKAYLLPQVDLCNGRYRLDIALMKRGSDKDADTPLVGIECDGYDDHYSTPENATETKKRLREIEMKTGIRVFSYTGKEIYSSCIELAIEFWKYVQECITPLL